MATPEPRRTPKEQSEQWDHDTLEGRRLANKSRDYFDGKQWTEQEANKLRSRRQAAIVVNRIKPKVEGLVGLYELRKSDPKAYPRTPKHQKSSGPITDSLRFVADNNDFDMTRLDVAEDFFVEGYAGAIIEVNRKKKAEGPDEIEIQINQIPFDRIYYDPHSRRKDFKDAKYMGIILWMNINDVSDAFPKRQIDFGNLETHSTSIDREETTGDRPKFQASHGETRVRLAMHFSLIKDVWKMTVFSGDENIIPTRNSPFLDDDGMPTNPIELVSANVDRENNRYGEVSGFLSQQDEINHRRSKFLHLNSMRQTFGNDNAIQNVAAAKRELAKPDGHVKLAGSAKLNEDFGIIPTGDMSNAQFNLYLDAKSELDAVSFNAQLSGERQSGDLSGKAIGKLQQAGTLELSRQYALLANWEKRVYEQVWARVKQFWNEEKWIRVTDDQDDLRWVGFNSQVTNADILLEGAEDESLPLEQQQEFAKIFKLLVDTQNPILTEIAETRNPTSELDVDIIIDQSPDVINFEQEMFELLTRFASSKDVDIIDLIELSPTRRKDELIQRIQRRRKERAAENSEAVQAQQQIDQGEQVSKIRKTDAETENISADTLKKTVETISEQVQTANVANSPDVNPQVSV